ncbi:MAG: lytic murein transglycosylase [Patescibacteria group bacterium]
MAIFNVYSWQNSAVFAADDAADIQDKIGDLQKKQEQTQKQLKAAQSLLSKNQLQVSTTKNLIVTTESTITRKEAELDNLNKRIELQKTILEEYLRELYYSDQEDPLVILAIENRSLSSIVDNFDQTLNIKEKILNTLSEIKQSSNEVEKTKVELEGKKDDHEKLLGIQQGQQYEIKSDITEAQATLAEVNAKINKLRSELSSLLGSSVSFSDIMDAAKFASKVTGIRKDYLLGVLVVESNLGRYTGGCTYKQSKMSGTRATYFKQIVKELGYNIDKVKVSCPPASYKGTGGAMGVAQFMPDTWMGYKSSIAAVTNHNPPDPWNLTDGVVAMALKLSKVSGVTAHKRSAEAKAYCVYLAGGNWASYCDSKGTDYGAKVLYWADNYERLLN